MRGFKKATVAVLLLFSMLFCSCSKSRTVADNLIAPPQLFPEQDSIMKALRTSVGEDISLEYPKTGENRSAFLMCDLNGDGENEVVAFYRPAASQAAGDLVHMNVLSSSDDRWSSVCDIVGEAAGIDRVSVGNFSGRCEIIVGWELMQGREKTLVCYSLSGTTPVRDYSAGYVEFAVADFWKQSEGDELITLNYSQTAENLVQPLQHARLICLKDAQFKAVSSIPLDSRVTGYKSCAAGKYSENSIGFFLDGIIDASAVNTQILTVGKNGQINNPLLKNNITDTENVHRSTMLTQDIDGDGVLEVPHQEAVTGYEDVPESEKLYKTVWKRLEGGALKKSAVMYISSTLGIRINIPQRLDGNVTIKAIAAQNELVFFEYSGSLEKSSTELFKIRVSSRELYERQDGYDILKSNDYTVVTVNITDEENELCPTWETLYNIIQII